MVQVRFEEPSHDEVVVLMNSLTSCSSYKHDNKTAVQPNCYLSAAAMCHVVHFELDVWIELLNQSFRHLTKREWHQEVVSSMTKKNWSLQIGSMGLKCQLFV